jgi:hypothetical protein
MHTNFKKSRNPLLWLACQPAYFFDNWGHQPPGSMYQPCVWWQMWIVVITQPKMHDEMKSYLDSPYVWGHHGQ